MGESLEALASKLSRLLNIPNSTDTLDYLLGIGNEDELKEFLYGLLDNAKLDHREVIESIYRQWKQKHVPAFAPPNQNYSVHKKLGSDTTALVQPSFAKSKRNRKAERSTPPTERPVDEDTLDADGRTKRRTKYVPLFGEGASQTDVQLPGRHSCSCQATLHRLVNNCLKCGKIVCQQEGSGPCFFCGNLVCTNEEEELLCRNSKASRTLLSKLMSKGGGLNERINSKQMPSREVMDEGSIQKAIDHKNKLLEYDRTVARRTKVIDDQSDYFNTENRWLTTEEREVLQKNRDQLQAKRDADKNSVKFSIDFAGRRLIEEENDASISKYEEELQRLCEESMRKLNLDRDAFDPGLDQLPKPSYDPTGLENVTVGRDHGKIERSSKTMRLQDKTLQEMSDEGWCLSMHQPYASMLVNGQKIHEGRSWFTPIRGRLWIASTVREASRDEIDSVKRSMRFFSAGEERPGTSDSFPVGALLGCVDLVDCVSQEQYRETYPEGESESPYVFICKNPRELIVKFPIRGSHKIYKLDARIHEAAKKTLKQ